MTINVEKLIINASKIDADVCLIEAENVYRWIFLCERLRQFDRAKDAIELIGDWTGIIIQNPNWKEKLDLFQYKFCVRSSDLLDIHRNLIDVHEFDNSEVQESIVFYCMMILTNFLSGMIEEEIKKEYGL